MSDTELRHDQLLRYRRHLTLPQFGLEGQQRLLRARVLLVGAGGLGCPTAQYLAAAGVGTLGLVDFDRIDLSNLQRQVLYGTADVGRPKVEVARERIAALNPDVRVEVHDLRLRADNVLELVARYDVVVDGSDNFNTRYLVSDACVLRGRPNVHGAVLRFEGQASVFDATRGPCYRCLHPDPPAAGEVPSCAEGGVVGVLPGLVALVQATETIKLLAGIGEPLIGRLLQIDALGMRFDEFRLTKDPECPSCGEHPVITRPVEIDAACAEGVGTASDPSRGFDELDARGLDRLRREGIAHVLLDVREETEHALARIDGARLMPLSTLEARLDELSALRADRIVVHCHHGGRSRRACELLAAHGFTQLSNLAGGIDAWSREIDPGVPRY